MSFFICCCDFNSCSYLFFFFNDTATTEIYTLSLHDALPICRRGHALPKTNAGHRGEACDRSEEHTSELQSPKDLVCRLLLEKKNTVNVTQFPANISIQGYLMRAESQVR